ncbi:hypothetical protein MMC18_001658 [Xylographa bjoerkii]|nr:hypothetical protein [Xylographa bjoerkii]
MLHKNVLIFWIQLIALTFAHGFPLSNEQSLLSRSSDSEFIQPRLLNFDATKLGPAGISRAFRSASTLSRRNDVIQMVVQRRKLEEAVPQYSIGHKIASKGSVSGRRPYLSGFHASARESRIGVVVKPAYATPNIAVESQRRNHLVERSLRELAMRNNNLLTRSSKDRRPHTATSSARSALAAKEKRDDCAGKHGIHHSNCEISQGFKKVGQDIKNVAQKAVKGVENVAKKVEQGVVTAAKAVDNKIIKPVEQDVAKAAKVVDNKVIKPVGKFIQKNGKILKEVAIEAGTAIAGAAIEAVTLGTGTGAVVGLEAGAQALVQVATKVPTVVKAVEGAEKVGKGIKDVIDAGKDAKEAASAAKAAAKATDAGKVKQAAAGAKAAAKSFGKNKAVQNAAKSGAKKATKEGERKVKEKYQQNQQGNNNGKNRRV